MKPVNPKNKPLRYPGVETRVQLIALALSFAFFLLSIQLWNLQVIQQDQYSEMAQENRIWPKRLPSDRGIIYGGNGEIIADNQGSADIIFVPGECPEDDREPVSKMLAQLLDFDAQKLLEEIADHKSEPFTQIDVKRDISRADHIRLQEMSYQLPGVFTMVRPQRRYLYGGTAGQLIGYLGEINKKELQTMDGYTGGDLIGRSGLERMYEDLLHGEDGYMVVTRYAIGRPQFRTDKHGIPYARRDSRGHIIEEEDQRQDPVSGRSLHLTLDMELQAYCEDVLSGEVGSVVVLNADTGEVLALASNPTYDPGIFVTRGMGNKRVELLNARNPSPMLHLGFQENYPPGSIFKVLMAAAALEEGVVTRESTFYCPGHYKMENVERRWHCWKRSGHGNVNLKEAMAFSCDVYFYNVGLKLGVDRIHEWSRKLGYDMKTGLDMYGEISGLIPSREWKKQLNKDKDVWEQKWYPGETLNLSIGQGGATCTPLQNAVLMASIVNGGKRVRPYLNKDLTPQLSDSYISQSHLGSIIAGMRYCVDKAPPAPTGTGNKAYIEGMTILGKTGSAQVMSLVHHEEFETEEDIPYEYKDHAWFVAGVMEQDIRIAMCVLVEHGHHGSSVAAPLAKQVIEFFYRDKADNEEPVTLAQGAGL